MYYSHVIYERNGVSNYRHLESFFDAHIKENSQITSISNRLLMHTSEKTSKLCVTGLCEGNLSVTGGMPPQRTSNAEIVSIW